MSSPNNNTQTRLTPNKRGNPLGCLFTLLLIAAVAGGLYWLWKNKDTASGLVSSLNLPGLNTNGMATPQQPSNQPGFSQNQPFNFPQNQGNPNRQTPGASSQKNTKTNKQDLKPNSKVQSGYPMVVSSSSTVKGNGPKLFSYKNVVPSEGLLPETVESLIAYPGETGNKLASKPDQIILFQTTNYERNKALIFATKRLSDLGFNKIQIPIDDYQRGGSTVIEATSKNGSQAFFAFKPTKENSLTSWKLELYKK
jgi:hypothetical protein